MPSLPISPLVSATNEEMSGNSSAAMSQEDVTSVRVTDMCASSDFVEREEQDDGSEHANENVSAHGAAAGYVQHDSRSTNDNNNNAFANTNASNQFSHAIQSNINSTATGNGSQIADAIQQSNISTTISSQTGIAPGDFTVTTAATALVAHADLLISALHIVEQQQQQTAEGLGNVNILTAPESPPPPSEQQQQESKPKNIDGRRYNGVLDSLRRWKVIGGTSGVGPGKRSLHVSAMRNSSSCLVFGGFDGSSRTNDMFTYDFATKTWRQIVPCVSKGELAPPSPRDRHVGVVHDDGFYVFGGYNGVQRVNDFHRFDCATEQWSRMPADPNAPSPRHSHAAAVYKDSMYIFGGYDGTYRNDLHEFNFTTGVWTHLPLKGRVPRCRYRTTLVVHNDHLFMFGGHDGARHLNEVHSFSFETKSWALVHTDGLAPAPRDSHVACVHDKSMYIFGGSSGSAMNDLHKLDLSTCKWEALSTRGDAPSPRFCHAAVKHDELLYMLGGYNGTTRLDDFYSYSFVPSSGHTVSRGSVRADLKEYLNNPQFSDVTFIVQGEEVYAHKLLCARCPFFNAMFQAGMRESEAGAKVDLPEVDRDTFLLLLEYLYTDQVDLTLENAVDVFLLADRFSVERLQKLCENALIKAIRTDNVAQLMIVADVHSATRLKDNCMLFIVRHFDTVSRTPGFEEMGRDNFNLLLEVLHAR